MRTTARPTIAKGEEDEGDEEDEETAVNPAAV